MRKKRSWLNIPAVTLASIERIVKLVAKHKAQLWIGHDKDITARIDCATKFYE